MFLLLTACASLSPSPAPSNWFYADQGGAIDWSSVHYEGADVVFRTVGDGLESGPVYVPWVATLACGEPTRLTLTFDKGEIADVTTVPANGCVADIADRVDWSGLALDGEPVYGVPRALVVLDVPGEEVAWSSS